MTWILSYRWFHRWSSSKHFHCTNVRAGSRKFGWVGPGDLFAFQLDRYQSVSVKSRGANPEEIQAQCSDPQDVQKSHREATVGAPVLRKKSRNNSLHVSGLRSEYCPDDRHSG